MYLSSEIENHTMVGLFNGYIEKKPLRMLLPYIDAMNIDLKAFNQDYYAKICDRKRCLCRKVNLRQKDNDL